MFICLQIIELEQARELGDKSEVDEVIDNARKEKDLMESQIANLQEQLSRSKCEVNKLKEQLRQLQEECKVRKFRFMQKGECFSKIKMANWPLRLSRDFWESTEPYK